MLGKMAGRARPDLTRLPLQNVLRVAPRLPPPQLVGEGEGQLQYPGWTQQSMAMGAFAFESFIEDGNNRWSLGALYSVHSLQLLSHFCIQEHAVTVDPSRRISFSTLPSKKPKSRSGPPLAPLISQPSGKSWLQSSSVLSSAGAPDPAAWTSEDPTGGRNHLHLFGTPAAPVQGTVCPRGHPDTANQRIRVLGGRRLSGDVSSWLDQGSFKGEMKEVVWDEEGEMIKLPTRPATWSPPDPNSTTHRCPPPPPLPVAPSLHCTGENLSSCCGASGVHGTVEHGCSLSD